MHYDAAMQSTIPETYRIATWNLDRPTKNRISKRAARLARIVEQEAHLWVLTETDRYFAIDGFRSVATARPNDPAYGAEEAYAAIHYAAALDVELLPTFDPCFAVCARFASSPLGPLIVYGSIITYHMEHVIAGRAKVWQRHQESAQKHGNDWRKLQRNYPNHTLVVAGDYNQALDGVGRYRNATSTKFLNAAFEGAGLVCLTTQHFAKNGALSRSSVDHIAISTSALARWDQEAIAWEGAIPEGPKLSDHNGVTVTLRVKQATRPFHE